MASLGELPTKRAGLGDEEERAGLAATEKLIIARLRDLKLEPTIQEVRWAWPVRGRDTRDDDDPDMAASPANEQRRAVSNNIIVELPGTQRPREVLILSAHFDAVPNCPGADDDGTGTAALLEIARAFTIERDAGNHPLRTIRLCFFTLEELGTVGSREYVRSIRAVKAIDESETPRRDDIEHQEAASGNGASSAGETGQDSRDRIIGMVSLEMLGYFSDEPDSQKSPIPRMKLPDGTEFVPPTVGDSIALVGIAKHQSFSRRFAREMLSAAPGLKVTTVDFAPIPIPDLLRSDHRPFIMAGLPGTMLTDTANFRNPHYHKPTDTIETIDPVRFTLVVKGVAGAAWKIVTEERTYK